MMINSHTFASLPRAQIDRLQNRGTDGIVVIHFLPISILHNYVSNFQVGYPIVVAENYLFFIIVIFMHIDLILSRNCSNYLPQKGSCMEFFSVCIQFMYKM